MTKIGRPNPQYAPPWFPRFFSLAPGDDLIEALQISKEETLNLMAGIPAGAEDFKYAEDKWTIKQAFIHLCDEERYYTYKAFCCSRQINANLEIPMSDRYTKDFNAANRTLMDVAEEYSTVRCANISLLSNMTDEMLDFNSAPATLIYSARSLGWFTVGHNIHHCNLIRERYLAKYQ